MTGIPLLDYCSTKRVMLEEEFEPSDVPHKECMFTTVMLHSIDRNFMDTNYFEEKYGRDKYIALCVKTVCPKCGEIKLDQYGEEELYLKIVPNTEENRKRFNYE